MDRREMLKGAAAVAPLIVAGSAFAAANVVRQEVAKIYDPVAVLEAMREREHHFTLQHVACTGYEVAYGWPFAIEDERTWKHCIPDFPSAVRWLHEQAAAVDAEFARRFPLPADLTNEQLDAVAEHLRATGQAKG